MCWRTAEPTFLINGFTPMDQLAKRPGSFSVFFGVGHLPVVVCSYEVAVLYARQQTSSSSHFEFGCSPAVKPHSHEIVEH